jgi:acyl-CoA thioesterase FadM
MARVKIDMPTINVATIRIRVRIRDINYGNHVGNDAFVSIIHEARLQWLQHNDCSEMDAAGTGLIMSDLAIEFKNECYYGEDITVNIFCGEISKVSFDLYYLLTTERKQQTILLARAKTGMVCFNYQIKKVSPIPTGLITILQAV